MTEMTTLAEIKARAAAHTAASHVFASEDRRWLLARVEEMEGTLRDIAAVKGAGPLDWWGWIPRAARAALARLDGQKGTTDNPQGKEP